MSAARDPWVILGVSRTATDGEIKSSYRKLARELHPDRNRENPEAAARFQDVARAYSSIRSQEARDRWLAENESIRPGDFPPFPQSSDPEVVPQSLEVSVDFRQAFSGTTVEVNMQVEDVCAVCGGTGAAPGHAPRRCGICSGRGEISVGEVSSICSSCSGKGYIVERECSNCVAGLVRELRPMSVPVPPGVEDGHQIKIAATDPARPSSREVTVAVRVRPSPVFKRTMKDPADLSIEVPVSFSEAVLGSSVRIPTPVKVVELRLPAGTPSGKVFKITGEGMPRRGREGRGDLYARMDVAVPDKPTRKQKKLAEELAGEDDTARMRYRLFNPEA